jgi:hypothetical protein
MNLSAYYKIVPGKRLKSAIDRLYFGKIADMKNIPQNPSFYAKSLTPISRAKQLKYDREYNRRYFAPWSQTAVQTPTKEIIWAVNFLQKKRLYTIKKHPITPSIYNWWIKNANFQALNSLKAKAISIKATNLRALPTDIGVYKKSNRNTEGFPFDYFQHSELHINVPLFVSHLSLDKKWAFVEAGHVAGWVRLRDIAFVNPKFIKAFKSGRYRVSIVDDLWLLNHRNRRVSLIKLGTIFPLDRSRRWLLTATKAKGGYALLVRVKPPSKSLVAPKPVPFNRFYVAKIARELYNEPYGWGGVMQTRDCSAFTRDFFAPFGIFLMRNSSKQAKEGQLISIKNLKGEMKKRAILQYAKPFRSMLYVPGHITLYLGKYKDEPIIMHSYWGVRLNDWSKYPLCRTIISTTKPGDELPNIRKKSELINTLQKIITF